MANKVDPELLLQNMLALLEKEPPPVPEDLRYLMDAVVAPLLNERAVPLSSLDYSRFEESDLDSLERYIDRFADKDHLLRLLGDELGRLSPLCLPGPVFC